MRCFFVSLFLCGYASIGLSAAEEIEYVTLEDSGDGSYISVYFLPRGKGAGEIQFFEPGERLPLFLKEEVHNSQGTFQVTCVLMRQKNGNYKYKKVNEVKIDGGPEKEDLPSVNSTVKEDLSSTVLQNPYDNHDDLHDGYDGYWVGFREWVLAGVWNSWKNYK